MKHQPIRAFTLIEISIVLIIIGLLVGGVLTGRELINQSGLRSFATEWQSHQAALNSYYLTYGALAGDHDNAVAMLGADNNGDDDGLIDLTDASADAETWYIWQHLQLAGLVEGTYTGQANGTGGNPNRDAVGGVNVPASEYREAIWTIWHVQVPANLWGVNPPKNMFQYGSATGNYASESVFTVLEIVNWLEPKYDDGLANSGRVRLQAGTGTTGAAPNFSYDTGSPSALPRLMLGVETLK